METEGELTPQTNDVRALTSRTAVGELNCAGRIRRAGILAGKRVMCFVGTPFQFLTLLCMFTGKGNCCYESLDLYVYPQFDGVYDMCIRFCNVIRVRDCFINENYDNPPQIRKPALMKCLESIIHSDRGRSRFIEAFPHAGVRHYDVVMCPSVNDHTITAKQICAPDGYTVFYDDGAGSHNGNVFKSNYCLDKVLVEDQKLFSGREWRRNKLKAIVRTLGGSYAQHDIRALYLFNPGRFEFELYPGIEIKAISIPDDVSTAQQCISPESNGDAYKDVRFVFLSLPGDVSDEALAIEEALIRRFVDSLDGFVVRPHPRRSLDDFESLDVRVVDNSDSWEILLMQESIASDVTLIGFGSSAQVHPKTLFDLEPRLVFLHRLLANAAYPSKSVDLMSDDINRRYRDKDRVLVIDSMGQCEEMLGMFAR